MIALVLAVLLGLLAFPVVLVFGPVYFPWSLLVLACLGGVLGLAVPPRSGPVVRAVGLSCVFVLAVLTVFVVSSNMLLREEFLAATAMWLLEILAPAVVGAIVGALLRAHLGLVRGTAAGAGVAASIGVLGIALAYAAAPVEIADAPTCTGGLECPRTQCAYMAERRRLLTIERVTAFDGARVACTYTAWGGVQVGVAEMGRGGGSWTDGAWPRFMSGRN